MAVTSRFNITEMAVGQSGGENLFNAALRTLDISVQLTAISFDTGSGTGGETGGEVYIVSNGGTVSPFTGKDNQIAYYDNGFKFIPAINGWVVFITDELLYYKFDGTTWEKQSQGLFPVEAKTGNYTVVTPDDVGKLFTNEGAGGTITFSLPAATVGQHYYFAIAAAQTLQVDPAASENISLPPTGVLQGNGVDIFSNVVGETLHVICAVTGTWNVWGTTGTWAV